MFYDLRKLGEDCDYAISSDSINEIESKIAKLESYLKLSISVEHKSHMYYFLGNLYIKKSALKKEKYNQWKNKSYPDNAVLAVNNLRKANEFSGRSEHYIKFEIKTNLANCLSDFGRHIEAINLWPCDFSLKGDSPFVSCYRKAKTLLYLANFIEDKYHSFDYTFQAYKIFKTLTNEVVSKGYSYFEKFTKDKNIINFIRQGDKFSKLDARDIEKIPYNLKYNSKGEKSYKEWCLDNCLFLTHLNDITKLPIAAKDIIQFPIHRTSINDGPYFLAAFSAIKREYSYARFLLYEGLYEKSCPRYELNNLYLTDTFDGVDFSLSTEKIKTAFRLVFSIFDKLAKIMVVYFKQQKNQSDAFFTPKFIREQFNSFENPFIASLFWLSCDLKDIDFENPKYNWKAPNPDAKKIREIRNSLEHNWLRVANGVPIWDNESGFDYASVVSRDELSKLALKSFQMVRSGIFYFIFSVIYNERTKVESNNLVLPQENPIWEPI